MQKNPNFGPTVLIDSIQITEVTQEFVTTSYLHWTRGIGWPGVFQSGLHLLRLQSLRVHAFQRRTSMLGFGVGWSNHWCTARGTQTTHGDAQDKNKAMRKETANMGGAESSSDGGL